MAAERRLEPTFVNAKAARAKAFVVDYLAGWRGPMEWKAMGAYLPHPKHIRLQRIYNQLQKCC